MQLFKLIFDHDLRLEDLINPPLEDDFRGASSVESERGLEMFLKPDLTYSRLYFSGSRLPEEQFGLNVLDSLDAMVEILWNAIPSDYQIYTLKGIPETLRQGISQLHPGQALVIGNGPSPEAETLRTLSTTSGAEPRLHRKTMGEELKKGHFILFKEQAHHGFDLQLYSTENIYRKLFPGLKTLLQTPDFRFFSINAKRMRSERMFYFEIWTLENPPHGFEEVFPESVL